eukprot:scaffold192937_cov14-Prasinocladus_malaysianus.AAC.2
MPPSHPKNKHEQAVANVIFQHACLHSNVHTTCRPRWGAMILLARQKRGLQSRAELPRQLEREEAA